MAKATISIIGLGRRGCSIGLALKTPELDFEVIGHDIDSEHAKKARSMRAVDSAPWNLIEACASADVVILAIPFDQVKPTLKAIGQELKPGCVVLDTSFLKQPVIEWADSYLGESAHFVGIALGINPAAMLDEKPGPDGARLDLFSKSPCCVMPAPSCRPEAVKTAQDVAILLGADPYFLDPAEYDGVSTAVNLMPALVAAALLGSVTSSPSWREMRRLSARALLNLSQPLEAGGAALALAAVQNQANTVHWLDTTIAELQRLREQIKEEDLELLTARLGALYQERENWLVDWELNRWEKLPASDVPQAGGLLTHLFGGLARPRQKKDS